MKTFTLISFLALIIPAAILAEEDGLHTWTSRSGQTLQGTFQKIVFSRVHIKNEKGYTIQIPLNKLVKEDVERAKQLARESQKAKMPGSRGRKTKQEEVKKAPDAICKLFGSKFKNQKKKSVSVDQLSDKVIGVYFSAHWCPPCRAFTPKLVEFYNELKKENKPFEVVFVSSDKDVNSMYEYMKEMKMPWLALPFGDKHKQGLAEKFNVSGIPKLVILKPSGELITENGRGEVSSKGKAVYDSWK